MDKNLKKYGIDVISIIFLGIGLINIYIYYLAANKESIFLFVLGDVIVMTMTVIASILIFPFLLNFLRAKINKRKMIKYLLLLLLFIYYIFSVIRHYQTYINYFNNLDDEQQNFLFSITYFNRNVLLYIWNSFLPVIFYSWKLEKQHHF